MTKKPNKLRSINIKVTSIKFRAYQRTDANRRDARRFVKKDVGDREIESKHVHLTSLKTPEGAES